MKARSTLTWLHRAALACALSTPAIAAVSDGLTHQWNFDETRDWHDSPFAAAALPGAMLDVVGGISATPVAMDNSAVVSGREFMALSFAGNGTKLQAAQNLAPELGGTATLAFWMRTTATGGADFSTSPGVTGTAAAAGGIQWGWLDASGRISFSADATLLAQSPQPVNDGVWHFIAITRNATTGAAQLYVDGTLVDSRTGPTGARNVAFQSLGRIENASGNAGCFVGRLDKLTVFNRVISSAEVATFMANHAPKTWNLTTQGVNDRAFGTDSVFKRAYDAERDPLTVLNWTTPNHGTITHNGDGAFTYTPSGSTIGTDSFDVTISDGNGGFHRSSITVNLVDEPPGGGGVPVTRFTNYAALQAGGADISLTGWRVPRAIDWNQDGKNDILVGSGGYVWLYLNTGSTTVPAFAAGVKVQAAGTDIFSGATGAAPIALTDMTGDGKADLIVADFASKLRVYPNTAAAGQAPVYGSSTIVKRADGSTDFVLPDKRFDLGDWNGDGTPDLVTGTGSGNVQLFLNTNTAASPRFETASVLFSESYNAYPRFCNLNASGSTDLVRGINWGDIRYWADVAGGLGSNQTLAITNADGSTSDIKAVTNGPIVDFADFNGDGKPDLLIGGHTTGGIYLATGVLKSPAESIAAIEAIYDAHLSDLGTALSANSDELLGQVNAENSNIASHIRNGTLAIREAAFTALATHIAKYPFLKYQQLDTTVYHHVPSIVIQNWVFLEYLLPSTPTRRAQIADILNLTGTLREIYLETGMALGDNGKSVPAAYATIRDLQRRHPRELFPDALLTIDQLYGDNRGGFIWTPNSAKNTFGQGALHNSNEWAGDLTTAIESVLGAGKASGDYFTFVMGHEVAHSLDGYVNSRANTDLRRRWGFTVSTAAGPDVVAGSNGWIDWNATRDHFIAAGLYDTTTQTWRDGGANDAWALYWSSGPGAAFKNLSFMRGSIDWFASTTQETLSTQANHHWANGPGRLIGALDRFRRGVQTGNLPMKANINEVVTYIDFLSAGMNRVNLVETKNPTGSNVIWTDHLADLERDDNGRITRIVVDGRVYNFTLNADGVVIDVTSTTAVVKPDIAVAISGQNQAIPVLANDYTIVGSPVAISSFTQPAHGTVTAGATGFLNYTSTNGYTGADSFTYTAGGITVTVSVTVVANTNGIILETWLNISGNPVANLTGNARFPNAPDQKAVLSTFETTSNRADSYGARIRATLTPTATGSYTFWIASDDNSELWLSTDSTPANKSLIASVTGDTSPRQWTKFPSQQSAAIALTAGQKYYIEVLHKEGGGGDNLAVAWQGPGISQQVIGGSYLSLFGLNNAPLAAADSAGVAVNATTSIAVLANDSDPDGDTIALQSVTQPANGSATIDGSNILYTPTTGFGGTDSFSYTVVDAKGGTATASVTVEVNKTAQTISFAPLAARTQGDAPFPLTASASSGLAVSYTSSNPGVATVSGDTVTIVSAGTTTITASQPGNAAYAAAADVSQSLVVHYAAGTSVWTNAAGGSWPTATNWLNNIIGNGAGNTAHFGALNLGANATVTLDGARTIGHLIFGDTTPSHNWTLNTGSGGSLTLADSVATPTITVENQSTTLGVVLAGADGLVKDGGGTLVLNNLANTFGGNLAVAGGTLRTPSGVGNGTTGPLGAVNGSRQIIVAGGATLDFQGNNVFGGSGESAATLPALTLSGTLSSTRFNILGNLTLNGGTLTQASTDSGNYEGYQFLGTVTVGGSTPSTIASTNGKANHLANGTTTFVVADATASPAADLVITNPLRNASNDYALGAGSLTKDGTGTLALHAASIYSGNTLIFDGTLLANNSTGSATGTGVLTVSAGATLGGSGSVSGAVTVNGALSPGNNGVGTLATGALTLAPGSAIAWEISDWKNGAANGYDRIIAPSLNVSATSGNPVQLTVTPASLANFTGANRDFILVQTTGGITGFTPSDFEIDATALPEASGSWAVAVSGNNLVLQYRTNLQTPVFFSDPIVGAAAFISLPYSGSIANQAEDPTGDPITFSKISGPAWLNVASDGTLSGTPTAADEGSNSFVVRVSDAAQNHTDAVLQIAVGYRPNSAPVFSPDDLTRAQATPASAYSATLAGAATDADSDPLTYEKLSGPAWLAIAANGSLSGTPASGNAGPNIFIVRVSDGFGGSDLARLTIQVGPPVGYPPNNYGSLVATTTTDEFIQRVQIADLDKTSGNNGGYADFRTSIAQLMPGQSLAYTLTPGWNATVYNEAWTVWIDLNRDGDFADTGENVVQLAANKNVRTGTLAIPANAATGPSRMRVAMRYNTPQTSPTGSYTFGEVEDYSVQIGTPPATNATPYFLVNPITLPSLEQGTAATGSLAAHAGDWENNALTFTKTAGPAWLSVASDGTLSGAPASGDVGANNFTIRATDPGGLFAEVTLNIQVTASNPDANSNGILDSWEITQFGNANPGANLPGDDADHDGLENLLEFALDSHPLQPNPSPLTYDFETVGADRFLRLTVPKNPAATNLTYTVETCGALNDWSSATAAIETNTAGQLIARDTIVAPRRFIRLRVTVNP